MRLSFQPGGCKQLSGVAGVQLNAGGSLANSLAGCAQLGRAGAALQQQSGDDSPREVRVGMAGCVGDDHLGTFFTSQLASAGVQWISQAPKDTGTGTVIVLTTPDADRAFLSYPGAPRTLSICHHTTDARRRSCQNSRATGRAEAPA